MSKVAVSPAQRFRTALASPKSTIHHLERLASKLVGDDIRNPDPRGVTSLAIAAVAGNLEVCEWLIFDEGHEEGEISRDTAGETVVHIAASHGFTNILDLYLSQYPFVVDWVDLRGATPLHVAAMKGELESAQILIDYAGADIIDAPDLYGNTPLHYASSWGKLPVVKLLVEMDCEVSAKNNEGFSAADYAFSFQGLRALDEYVRAHAEAAKRQHRSRKYSSPKASRALRHAPSSVMSNTEPGDLQSSSSIPTTPPVGLGFAFDPKASHAQRQDSPTRSLRPQASPTQHRSPSQRSDHISPSNSTSYAPLATPPATASGSRPATPAAVASASRPSSRPTTPSLSPLSLKRLGRNPSSNSTLAPGPPSPAADSIRKIALRDAGNIESFRYEHGGAASATIKAPARSRSHSALPGEEGNDLAPVATPSRSASLKIERGGAVGKPPLPLPLALQGRTRSESNHSQVSSGSSIAPASRTDSTLSSPARSRSNSTAQPSQPLFPPSSSTGFQPSPPSSPNTAAQTIAGVFKSSSAGKKERERKGSVSTVGGEADARTRSGSNESQVSGGRVARALGLGRRQHSGGA